jgi:hypothetical protein
MHVDGCMHVFVRSLSSLSQRQREAHIRALERSHRSTMRAAMHKVQQLRLGTEMGTKVGHDHKASRDAKKGMPTGKPVRLPQLAREESPTVTKGRCSSKAKLVALRVHVQMRMRTCVDKCTCSARYEFSICVGRRQLNPSHNVSMPVRPVFGEPRTRQHKVLGYGGGEHADSGIGRSKYKLSPAPMPVDRSSSGAWPTSLDSRRSSSSDEGTLPGRHGSTPVRFMDVDTLKSTLTSLMALQVMYLSACAHALMCSAYVCMNIWCIQYSRRISCACRRVPLMLP